MNAIQRGAVVGMVEDCWFQQAQMTGACNWRGLYEEEMKPLLETASTDATLVRVLAVLSLLYKKRGESEEAKRFPWLANDLPKVSATSLAKRKARQLLAWYKDN